jgi:acyl-homoserine-lactone acylase
MVAEMTPDGPEAVGLLAYGQSGDPGSEHHLDGTRAYADARVRTLRFRDEQIEADPTLRRLVVGPTEA